MQLKFKLCGNIAKRKRSKIIFHIRFDMTSLYNHADPDRAGCYSPKVDTSTAFGHKYKYFFRIGSMINAFVNK